MERRTGRFTLRLLRISGTSGPMGSAVRLVPSGVPTDVASSGPGVVQLMSWGGIRRSIHILPL